MMVSAETFLKTKRVICQESGDLDLAINGSLRGLPDGLEGKMSERTLKNERNQRAFALLS